MLGQRFLRGRVKDFLVNAPCDFAVTDFDFFDSAVPPDVGLLFRAPIDIDVTLRYFL